MLTGSSTRNYMKFNKLGLSDKVLQAVHEAGYDTATPIQAGAIPPALERKDVLGLAQTGSGKTAAFTLPMLNLLEKGRARARMPRTLILEPTRELAAQVEEAFDTLGKHHKLTVALLIGGVSFAEQNTKIDRGADVLIATPGRLLDHIERGKLMLHGIEVFVVDEADRMLDMGFIPDIEKICKMLPITRQTLFFSATMPPEIKRITNQFLHMPEVIEVSKPASTAETITQNLIKASKVDREKRDRLRDVLEGLKDVKNAIVFANRKRTVGILEKSMQKHGYNAAALHGDMDQQSRLKTLEGFRNNEITYLIASDVAARGLDIPDVSHVINYDVPIHADDYVHRIGRTGRAGREGTAIMLVTPPEKKALAAILKLIEKDIPWMEYAHSESSAKDPEDVAKEEEKPAKRKRGGRKAKSEKDADKAEQVSDNAGDAQESKASNNERTENNNERAEKPRSKNPRGRNKKRGNSVYDEVGSVPDSNCFHEGNMPAFLAHPLIVTEQEVKPEPEEVTETVAAAQEESNDQQASDQQAEVTEPEALDTTVEATVETETETVALETVEETSDVSSDSETDDAPAPEKEADEQVSVAPVDDGSDNIPTQETA